MNDHDNNNAVTGEGNAPRAKSAKVSGALHYRLRVLAAQKSMPMQALLDQVIATGLEAIEVDVAADELLADIERRCGYLAQPDALNGKNPLVYVAEQAGRIKTAARRLGRAKTA